MRSSFYTFGMEWQFFALLQMALITIGTALAFGLHNRKLNKQNLELRTYAELAQNAASSDPHESLKDALQKLDQADPLTPLFEALLNNVMQPAEDFAETFSEVLKNANLGSTSGADELAAELQARIDELEAQLSDSGAGQGSDSEQTEELKSLLQQFTHDSREMMACIQTLEKENAELKAALESDASEPGNAQLLDESQAEAIHEDEAPDPSATPTDEVA